VSENEEDFAAMFEASIKTRRLEPGQTVQGTVVAIGDGVAFVDVGAKGEATIALDELRDDDGALEVGVGDRIQATLTSMTGGLTLSRKLQRGAATARQLEDAYRSGLPVEGKVERSIKAGYEVGIARQRAFCPISQIDIVRHADPEIHVGRVYAFKIVEYRDDGRKFVVSRRALLDEEQKARAADVRATIVPGAVVTGRVVSVQDFGAFIDLGGGVQGLLHVSEMGWSRVANVSQFVSAGQALTVKVLRVDQKAAQIALGLKQLTADPWSAAEVKYQVGQVVEGRVTRIADFGAFVELEPGIEALAHASTFPPTGKAGGWSKSIAVGTTAAFEILSVDGAKRRIGAAMVEEGSSRAGSSGLSRSAIVPGARLTGKVERHEKFGVFVFLVPGLTGLLPIGETGIGPGQDLRKALPVGSDVDVIVVDADSEGRRIRLSVRAIAAADEAAEVRQYAEREDRAESRQSLGSLADKLRGALGNRVSE
jgi:small subunit ribosomal protein S1